MAAAAWAEVLLSFIREAESCPALRSGNDLLPPPRCQTPAEPPGQSLQGYRVQGYRVLGLSYPVPQVMQESCSDLAPV